MVSVLNFYLDDSGTRRPNHKVGKAPQHGYDWFALGGVLIEQKDESEARDMHSAFCSNWKITKPLHSSEIRSQNLNFEWLRQLDSGERERFYEELYLLMSRAPLVGLACVIDRPGYMARYGERYQNEPWVLCKTAFAISIERAAKFAQSKNLKLRVAPERCNKEEDAWMNTYYNNLKKDGLPFDSGNSDQYAPLKAEDFSDLLYEFRLKNKSSPMAQMADLFLWPICMGGYHAGNRPYARLRKDGKLIECHLSEEHWPRLATKYSCFDKINARV